MGLVARDAGGGDFTPAPAGNHVARCIRIIDLGTQPAAQYKPRHQALFVWELPEEQVAVNGEPMPLIVQRRYTVSLHRKSSLRSDLEAWRGQPFSQTELQGFELRAILDAPCMLSIVQVEREGTTYANVRSIAKLHKSMRALARVHPLVYYTIDEGESQTYRGFSAALQRTIQQAEEWTGERQGAPDVGGDPGVGDDDIPF